MAESSFQTLGRYTIRAELGRGGFATVYRALDSTLNREVALKILHPQLLTDRVFAERFRKEARALAGLRHPNIITVYDVSEAEGRLYIAMELAHGPSLAQAIAEHGRILWSETLALLKPVCEALDYAHAQGVVHRDLKPANILLDKERGSLLTDFGFARLMGESSVSMSLSGGILGTPAYIAPEVWELEVAQPSTDIYALGCILYEMLTGAVLFAGKTPMQAMRAHDRGPQFPPAWPEGVPAGIEAVLQSALARQSDARYPSASALWHSLNDLEAQAQAGRELAERAATASQWKTEAKAALAAGEWSAAKMAVGRWLAITPEDPAAQAAQTEIERQEAEVRAKQEAEAGARQEAEARTKQEAERRAAEEAARKAREEREWQARAAQEAAQKKTVAPGTPPPLPSRVTPQPALTSKRRVPIWVRIGGGLALLACVILGALIAKWIFPPPATPAPTAAPTQAPGTTEAPTAAPTEATGPTQAPAPAVGDKWCSNVRIVFFPGGPQGGIFAANIYNGAKQAEAILGPKVDYVWSDWDPRKMIQQFQESATTKPDGIAVMGHPGDESFDSLINDAEKQGIIVTSQNTPLPKAEAAYQPNGFGYVGAELYQAGHDLGVQAFQRSGVKKGDRAMVWGLISQPTRGLRTKGVMDALKEAGMTVDYIEIDAATNADPAAGAPTFAGYVSSHPDVKLVVTDHGGLTATAQTYLTAANKKPGDIYIAGFDLSPATATAIQGGWISLVIDQQEWLQGYLPILQICLSKVYGFSGMHINTGTGFVDKSNVDFIAPLAQKNIR